MRYLLSALVAVGIWGVVSDGTASAGGYYYPHTYSYYPSYTPCYNNYTTVYKTVYDFTPPVAVGYAYPYVAPPAQAAPVVTHQPATATTSATVTTSPCEEKIAGLKTELAELRKLVAAATVPPPVQTPQYPPQQSQYQQQPQAPTGGYQQSQQQYAQQTPQAGYNQSPSVPSQAPQSPTAYNSSAPQQNQGYGQQVPPMQQIPAGSDPNGVGGTQQLVPQQNQAGQQSPSLAARPTLFSQKCAVCHDVNVANQKGGRLVLSVNGQLLRLSDRQIQDSIKEMNKRSMPKTQPGERSNLSGLTVNEIMQIAGEMMAARQ